jgi:hypothetical protein
VYVGVFSSSQITSEAFRTVERCRIMLSLTRNMRSNKCSSKFIRTAQISKHNQCNTFILNEYYDAFSFVYHTRCLLSVYKLHIVGVA